MAQLAGKRSTMTLYIKANDPYSHKVRIVLQEKGISAEIIDVSSRENIEDLLEHNPHGSIPTLIDRKLVLYEIRTLIEYLDERYPHPPLLPVYPTARATSRQVIYKIESELYPLLQQIENASKNTKISNKEGESAIIAQKKLENGLSVLEPIFKNTTYFLNDDFTLVDCCMAALLWRLNCLGVKLEGAPQALQKYRARLFERDSVKATLNEVESGVKI